MDDLLPLSLPQNAKSQSYAVTEVRSVKHVHTWVVKGFSHSEVRYLETVPIIPGLEASKQTFRVRLHPQGNKESNKDFCFFQVFSQSGMRFKAKFHVANSRGDDLPATVYSGTQQLNGYFEYVRREQLIQHIQPQDEIKLTLHLTVYLDTVTRSASADPPIALSPGYTLKSLSQQLFDSFKDIKFADFTIKCFDEKKQEKEIKCHRHMLYSRSPVFRAMLQDHTIEYKNSEVKFDDIDYEVLLSFIEFIYSGTYSKYAEDIALSQELLKLGDRFEVLELRDAAEAALRKQLTVDNICEILQTADYHNSQKLRRECLHYFSSHAAEVIRTEGWTILSSQNPDVVTACMAHMLKAEDSEDPTPPSKRFRGS